MNVIKILSAHDFVQQNMNGIRIDEYMFETIVLFAQKYAEYCVEKRFQKNIHLADVNNSVIAHLSNKKSEFIIKMNAFLSELTYANIITTEQHEQIRNYIIETAEN